MITVHEDRAVEAGDFFWECYQLLQNVGINISYCVLTPVRGGDWFHQSIVDSYLAAAGNDIDTFMKWINEGHGFDHFDETFNEDNSIIAKMFEAQKLHRE